MRRKADLKWRVLELAKKTSWANKNHDYCADENGHPLTQRDFDVAFQRVSEAVDELVEEGFLRRKGRIMIVIERGPTGRRWFPRSLRARPSWTQGANLVEMVRFERFR